MLRDGSEIGLETFIGNEQDFKYNLCVLRLVTNDQSKVKENGILIKKNLSRLERAGLEAP